MFSYTYKESPYSIYGGGQSMEGTPETKLTSFSPEDLNHNSYFNTNSTTNSMDNVHDPFFGTSSKPKSEGKLSATASAFEPFGLGVTFGSISSTKSLNLMAPKSAGPLPGTAQYLESIIAAEENSPRRRAERADPPAPPVTKSGFFTTEAVCSRHVKITSIFLDDVRDQVREAIDVRFFHFHNLLLRSSTDTL